MGKFFEVLAVILPIFTAVALGAIARRKDILNREHMEGLQRFVIKFCLPCVLFNSCYGASFSLESVASMVMVPPVLFLSTLWAFRMRKSRFPYHNLPMLFAAQESGMLGIPLFMTLFGAAEVYRIGVLDLAQSVIAIPVIAILASNAGENASTKSIVKSVFSSPLLLMGILGFVLNVSGCAAMLNRIGVGTALTATTSFLSQPISAAMLFSVGYNFSFDSEKRSVITRLSVIHFVMFAAVGLIMQLILSLVTEPALTTRVAVLIYTLLPSSYLSPSLGRRADDYAVASGVCSILTIVTLLVFCGLAAFVG